MKATLRLREHETRTKIVATLGPACRDERTMRAMIREGADAFRLNLSHGEHGEHARMIRAARRAARAEGRPVAILADLQGPKIRVGSLEGGQSILIHRGEELVIVARADVVGRPGRVGCTYGGLARDVKAGERLLLDDGYLELEVLSVDGDEVTTRVTHGGILHEHKGINLPGTTVTAKALTRKDLADLDFVLAQDVDLVALSFVRRAADVTRLRRRIERAGHALHIVAKIERPEAVENLREIIEAADGIMVARGDLGVEVGAEAVPGIQKRTIALTVEAAKPVITATQMLESMIENPRPTRAEASDVANAIYDGTTAVMLSGETAVGRDPALVVRTMERIARRTEEEIVGATDGRMLLQDVAPGAGDDRTRRATFSIAEATVHAAARAALDVNARAVVVFTQSGRTARLVARERLQMPVLAFTHSKRTQTRLALEWGITPIYMPRARTVASLHGWARRHLIAKRYARVGDLTVLIAGTINVTGATDSVRVGRLRADDET